MSQVFHDIEKKILETLQKLPNQTPEQLSKNTELSIDQIRRGIEWLRLKDLALVNESEKITFSLGPNGLDSFKNGLPERKLINLLKDKPKTFEEIRSILSGAGFNVAIANAKKNGWIKIEKNNSDSLVSIKEKPVETPEEKLLSLIGEKTISQEEVSNPLAMKILLSRPNYIVQTSQKSKTVSLTDAALSLDTSISSSGAIDVEADVPSVFAARTHPLQDTIDEIREIFVNLGFSEILGNMTQSSFWNFDALFTPQDHPARELQDTFYLENTESKNPASSSQIKNVSSSHKKNWKYDWKLSESQKMVLRTHTTCVTIKHLAEQKPDNARIFSVGRVFRNEKVSYKHLVEFNQIEGIVIGNNTTLRDLMGIQKEFYKKLGLTKIKFWPTFFPYTEPSLQTMVYNEKLGKWIELFGMGIFRPEVTKPLGIDKPVLAWGGGIERIAMLKYELDDVREFYNNNLSWLRSA
ncbi:MAG: phenylalanine--tRNA ligase subunit alpha [Candidatus Nitrosopelagicus sp.]|nr:phenylalanine--tRNA ligase subunit alpha [Candidatus Nitrosopelagicus sp.]